MGKQRQAVWRTLGRSWADRPKNHSAAARLAAAVVQSTAGGGDIGHGLRAIGYAGLADGLSGGLFPDRDPTRAMTVLAEAGVPVQLPGADRYLADWLLGVIQVVAERLTIDPEAGLLDAVRTALGDSDIVARCSNSGKLSARRLAGELGMDASHCAKLVRELTGRPAQVRKRRPARPGRQTLEQR